MKALAEAKREKDRRRGGRGRGERLEGRIGRATVTAN
jgi:hypothetical protein